MVKEVLHHNNKYRISQFVVSVENNGVYLLYNTITGGIVLIESEDDFYTSIESLIEMKYFVPFSFDEFKWVTKLKTSREADDSKGIVQGFTILTSTDCNARCFYCYEKGQRRISMTEGVANDVADYIEKVSSNSPVDLRWFGGEPLINTNAIDIICKRLISKGVGFESKIVSNGLLFSDSVISKAKDLWLLKSVQISLDGTKDVYQNIKAYRGAVGNEFEKVISNIHKLIQSGIHVSIRLNQDLYNTDDLHKLVDFLSLEFKGEKLISIYNSLLYDECSELDSKKTNEKYKRFVELQEKIIESGLYRKNVLIGKLRSKHCMADYDSSVLITPNGDIGKCEHYTDKHIIGSIYSAHFDNLEIAKWKDKYNPEKKCFTCPLYPQCIRIKMCPVESRHCSFTQCENKIYLIKRALLQKLESYEKDC